MAKVTLDMPALYALTDAKAESGLRRAALQGEARLKMILSQPGSGRVYGRHQASAPGSPPAPDTGQLRAATQADTQIQRDGEGLKGRIVANKDYAEALEKGTEKMAARPFLNVLITDHADELKQAFYAGARA